ncbi:MAG: rubredoxin [Nitrospirota bacterium]
MNRGRDEYLASAGIDQSLIHIPIGTAFEDLPEDWVCPVCGADDRLEAGGPS